MKKEYDVVMLGSLIKRTDEEDSILNKAIEEGVNWIEVGGILLNHRLSGYFYNNVSNQNLQTIPEEMRKNLKALIKGQVKCTLCQGHYDFSFSDFYFIFVCCVEASK